MLLQETFESESQVFSRYSTLGQHPAEHVRGNLWETRGNFHFVFSDLKVIGRLLSNRHIEYSRIQQNLFEITWELQLLLILSLFHHCDSQASLTNHRTLAYSDYRVLNTTNNY